MESIVNVILQFLGNALSNYLDAKSAVILACVAGLWAGIRSHTKNANTQAGLDLLQRLSDSIVRGLLTTVKYDLASGSSVQKLLSDGCDDLREALQTNGTAAAQAALKLGDQILQHEIATAIHKLGGPAETPIVLPAPPDFPPVVKGTPPQPGPGGTDFQSQSGG